jgi:hypothetical protein
MRSGETGPVHRLIRNAKDDARRRQFSLNMRTPAKHDGFIIICPAICVMFPSLSAQILVTRSETRRDPRLRFVHVTLCSEHSVALHILGALCGQLATQTDLESIHGSANGTCRRDNGVKLHVNVWLRRAALSFPLVINNDK